MGIPEQAAKVLETMNRAGAIASHLHLDNAPPQRHRIAWALLRLAFDHARSMAFLIANQQWELTGSAFALARVTNDALVRGAWFALHANDDQTQRFLDKDEIPSRTMSADVEGHPPFDSFNIFTQLRNNVWDLLNSFTHSGVQAIGAYIDGETIGPAHRPEDVHAILGYAESVAVVAILILVMMTESQDPTRVEPLKADLMALVNTPK